MVIIPDSSVLVSNFQFSSKDFTTFFGFFREAGHSIAIPDVVLQETLNKYSEEMDKDFRSLKQTIKNIQIRSADRKSIHIAEDLEQGYAKRYQSYIDNICKSHSIEILPLPTIGHDILVKRALSRTKPFSPDGRKGYRDALIWYSLLELLEKGNVPIAFLCNNTRDFSDESKKELHPSLAQELKRKGYAADSILLFPNLSLFIESQIISNLPTADQTLALFQRNSKGGDTFEVALEAELPKILENIGVDHGELGKPDSFESITVAATEEVAGFELYSTSKLDDGQHLLNFHATVGCTFDTFLFKSGFYLDDDINIWDSDWNKHYMTGSFGGYLSVDALATVDTKIGKITSLQLLEYEGVNPFD